MEKEPYLLSLETSTDVCSVAISQGNELLSIRNTSESFSHSEVITLFIIDCLKEAQLNVSDLSAVCVSQGPGSYTALRIGASTGKGICFAQSIPLIAVNSLEALAYPVHKEFSGAVVIPMLDARRNEVYMQVYDQDFNLLEDSKAQILDESTFETYGHFRDQSIVFCGNGAKKAKDLVDVSHGTFIDSKCNAQYIAELGRMKYHQKSFENLSYYEPFYLKAPNITVQKKNLL